MKNKGESEIMKWKNSEKSWEKQQHEMFLNNVPVIEE